MTELEITTRDDIRSELFHVQTELNAARAAEKRYLWYTLLGGSPGILITAFAILWGRGLLLGVVLLLLPLWYVARWTMSSRTAHELELKAAELEDRQALMEGVPDDADDNSPT